MTPVDDCEAWSTGVLPVCTEGSVTPDALVFTSVISEPTNDNLLHNSTDAC